MLDPPVLGLDPIVVWGFDPPDDVGVEPPEGLVELPPEAIEVLLELDPPEVDGVPATLTEEPPEGFEVDPLVPLPTGVAEESDDPPTLSVIIVAWLTSSSLLPQAVSTRDRRIRM